MGVITAAPAGTAADDRPTMRRPLPRAARIALVALLLLMGAEGALRMRASALPAPPEWPSPNLDRKIEQIDALSDRGGASVVFLGSSAVDSSLDPSALKLTKSNRPAYNASVRGGTIAMVSHWARTVVVPRLRPDVVVLGVASRELDENGAFMGAIERKYFDAPAVRHLDGTENVLQAVEHRLESASVLFRHRTTIRDPRYVAALLGAGDAPEESGVEADVADDGQLQRFEKRAYRKTYIHDIEPTLRISETKTAELRSLLSYLRTQTQRVVVVNMPVTDDYLASQAAGQRAVFDKLLATEAQRAGAGYLRPGIWSKADFADPIHANANGAKRLTAMVQTTIADAGTAQMVPPGVTARATGDETLDDADLPSIASKPSVPLPSAGVRQIPDSRSRARPSP